MEEYDSKIVVSAINKEKLEHPKKMFLLVSKLKKPLKCQSCGDMICPGEEYIMGKGIGAFCVACVDFE